jgi:hypothetical protein
MKKIFKYEIKFRDKQVINLPLGADILNIQYQESTNQICLWAVVDPNCEETTKYNVYIVGTGHEITEDVDYFMGYFSTVQVGSFDWHIFLGDADV